MLLPFEHDWLAGARRDGLDRPRPATLADVDELLGAPDVRLKDAELKEARREFAAKRAKRP